MLNLEELNRTLTETVKSAVAAESHKLRGGIAVNEMIVSTLRKPILSFPEDVQLVLGLGRSTAFALINDDATFPARSKVGRKQFVRTDRFLAWLESKSGVAA